MTHVRLLTNLLIVLTAAWSAVAAEIHVSPDGNDGNDGSESRPLRTLEAARDAVRALRAGKADKTVRHTVVLHGGAYPRDKTFELDERDSYTTYTSHKTHTPRLIGGVEIPVSAVKPVTDGQTLARLVEEGARSHLHVIDLKKLGITDYGRLGPRGFRRAYIPAPLELFIDGKPMQVARWPNAGEPHIKMGKVVDRGSTPRTGDYSFRPGTFEYGVERPRHWEQARNFYISGLFCWGYADDTIEVAKLDTERGTFTTTHPHLYGFARRSFTAWYALNLLEEIDVPGEYFVDGESGRLYFYPPEGFGAGSRLAVSLMEKPFVALEGARGVELEGLVLEVSRGTGVYIERGADNVIRGCTLRNLGILAAQLGMGIAPFPYGKHDGHGNKADGKPGEPVSRALGSWHEHIYKYTAWNRQAGTGHRIIGCDIYDIGAGGISLGGGDRKTLTPANNAVINCDIYRVNRWGRTYKAMVNIDGVGNRIAHCHLHEGPGGAIYLHGNDHVVEYNEIDHVLTDQSDMGAIYMGRDPSETGNEFRCNFFHHIKNNHAGGHGVQAIFFDDCSIGGADIVGNVFYRAGSTNPIKFNGGGACDIDDNIFIDCPPPVGGAGNNTGRVRSWMASSLGKERLLERVNITEPPYSDKYPRLLAIYRGQAPVVTKPRRSIVTTASDPRFVDGAEMDFTLRPNAQVPDGFQRTEFGKIGLYAGDGRHALPGETAPSRR